MKQTVLGASADKDLRGVVFRRRLGAVIPSEAAAALAAAAESRDLLLRVRRLRAQLSLELHWRREKIWQ